MSRSSTTSRSTLGALIIRHVTETLRKAGRSMSRSSSPRRRAAARATSLGSARAPKESAWHRVLRRRARSARCARPAFAPDRCAKSCARTCWRASATAAALRRHPRLRRHGGARGRERAALRARPDLPRRTRAGEDAHDPPARRAARRVDARSSPAARSTTTRSRRSRRTRARCVAEHGDATPIAWVHRDDRYVEKLATPDVSIADLIGDVDPVKVAEGRSLADELTIHFGLMPRTNRGIFCINELPDLTEKVQVGLFNVMEERDVQVKGYRVRLPLDVLVVASANPEDYTSRGRIITPLKDRYAAQIRTHYPRDARARARGRAQEAQLPRGRRRRAARAAPSWRRSSPSSRFQARKQRRREPGLGRLGAHVDRELRDARRRTRCAARCASASAKRCRASRTSRRSTPRPAASSSSSTRAASAREREVVARAGEARDARRVFDERVPLEGIAERGRGASSRAGRSRCRRRCRRASTSTGLDADRRPARRRARGSRAATRRARLASAIEFVLEGLHLAQPPQQDRGARGRRALRGAIDEGLALQPLGRHAAGVLARRRRRRSTRSRDLLMEGLSADEALEWMRAAGFELAGLDMRVMGVEELLRGAAQRGAARSSSATAWTRRPTTCAGGSTRSSTASRRAQRERHGFESQRMNEFLDARSHAQTRALSRRDRALPRLRLRGRRGGRGLPRAARGARAAARARAFLAQRGAALPRPRSRRLRDGAADPRAHRGARAARARPRRGQLRADLARAAARAARARTRRARS